MPDPTQRPQNSDIGGEPTRDSADIIPFRRRSIDAPVRPGAEPEVVTPTGASEAIDGEAPLGSDGEPQRTV